MGAGRAREGRRSWNENRGGKGEAVAPHRPSFLCVAGGGLPAVRLVAAATAESWQK